MFSVLDLRGFAYCRHSRNISFCCMWFFLQIQFQNKVVACRQAEYERLRKERHERIEQILQKRKEERESKRKMLFYLSVEEERLKKLQEEEEARKLEGTYFLQNYLLTFSTLLER